MTINNKKMVSTLGVVVLSIALALLICISFLPKPMFHGDYPYYPDVESITNAADVIIVGEVVTAREVKNLMVDKTPNKADKEATPYTLSTVKVIDVIKGDIDIGDVLTIKQLGDYKNKPEATLHEMDGYIVNGTEQLMFLCEYEDTPYSPVNPAQGIMEVRNDVLHSNNRYSLFGYSTDAANAIRTDDSLDIAIESIKKFTD
jgi:hypothetical protein